MIDLSIGEAHIIKEALFDAFELKSSHLVHLKTNCKSEYPPTNGYAPLVKLLEEKHQAPVIITNGAKQALGASFFAMHKAGKRKLGMRTPYWSLIPPLANIHGLKCVDKYDCYLAVLPNNPDGFMFGYEYIKYLYNYHKELGIPFIHDAAYYTSVYLNDYDLLPLGDIQIYSISKMFGLSGLRVGYVVCYDTRYYNIIKDYVETMTVGVSNASQDICYNIFKDMNTDIVRRNKFVTTARNKIQISKALCKTIHKDVLEVQEDIENIPGLFGWFKIGKRCDLNKANIKVSDGKFFGDEKMVRINLGVPTDVLIEAVNRLNKLVD